MKDRRAQVVLRGVVAAGMLASLPLALEAPAAADSVIVVDTTDPRVDGTDGRCSLVEALWAAELDSNEAVLSAPPAAIVTTSCTPGNGADTIVLPAGAVITLTRAVDDLRAINGPAGTPSIRTPVVIEGNGARLERSGGAAPFRAFNLHHPGELTLRNLHVKGFFAKGGNGRSGGGGGMGAGGAVNVGGAARLLVEGSTFEGNRAEGGNGGGSGQSGGGGGGGVGGDGGAAVGRVEEGFSSGGGGGGGARGDGGNSVRVGPYGQFEGGYSGGGGGGTITDGQSEDGTEQPDLTFETEGGEACGGRGGGFETNGLDGCAGGGGGGGSQPDDDPFAENYGEAGNGGHGGGGGGGGHAFSFFSGRASEQGGNGGFGGGGGAGGADEDGGHGGFGGGGGGGTGSGGTGGTFGGRGGGDDDTDNITAYGGGGGGAGLGGAIFSDRGLVTIRNSTFTGNSVSRGVGGPRASNGADAGGAIFGVDGDIILSGATIAGNESTGAAAGVAMYKSTNPLSRARLTIDNSIVAMNLPITDECSLYGGATSTGAGNLFTDNQSCAGQVVSGDPGLQPLAIEAPGVTPTMAIDATSIAFDAGSDDVCERVDQRDVSRPRSLHCDIGAYEYIKPSSDLAVATTPLGRAVAGDRLDLLIQVTNNGPTAAEQVTVTDTLPVGAAFVSITGSGGFTCTGTGPVTCTNPLMREGATALLTLTVQPAAATANGTTITNRVAVQSAKTPDPVPANNDASAAMQVATIADVSIGTTGPAGADAGTGVTYAISAANAGPSVARNTTMSGDVPAGATFRSLTASAGWACTTPTVGTSGPAAFSCTRSALDPGAAGSFTLDLAIPSSVADGTRLCTTTRASSATNDPDPGDGTAETCTTVRARADLRVSQVVTATGRPGRGSATFTVTIVNDGPSDSQQVSLAATTAAPDTAPQSAIGTAGASCSVAGTTATCTWPTIAHGSEVQVQVTVPWRSSVGSICMTSTATAGTHDPNATNSRSSGCISKR